MKFKTYVVSELTLEKLTSSVSWSGVDEVYTCSNDYQILKWNSMHREMYQAAKLPEDFCPTSMDWLIGSSGGKGNDLLLITSLDGRFVILNKGARVEKNISAHQGSAIGKWSPDYSGLLTAGEDGYVKIWSRSGMLRSTVIQNEMPIRCACWSPTSSAILFSQGSSLAIKPLLANSKTTKWRAHDHDHEILCVAWSVHGLIASGAEDCRYKIWDGQSGANVYTSSSDEYPITAIGFNSDGQLLAVGGFNMVRLCNKLGWTYSIIRFTMPAVGSLFNLSWSPDGTQIVTSSSSGSIIFGHVIEREKISKNLRALTTGRKKIQLQDILTKSTDNLDFSEKILKWELNYGHLVVATTTQIHIFNENYVNTPIIIDGRSDVRLILLGKKHFLVVDLTSVWIYSYTGRNHLNPRFPSIQAQVQFLTEKTISLGHQSLVIRDNSNHSMVHVFDLLPGATRQEDPRTIQSKTPITDVALSQTAGGEDQYLVFIDVNHDLFLTTCNNQTGTEGGIFKIGTQIVAVMWSSDTNILVGLHDSACYSVWYAPGEAASDPTLIALTTSTHDLSEFGKNTTIESFEGSQLTFQSSGTLFTVSTKIYCDVLHKCVADGNQWTQAVRICRLTQSQILWAVLAALATKHNQLEISEESYSAALQIDKVEYLQHVKALLQSNQTASGADVEAILIRHRKYSDAIEMALCLHRWDAALDIADKHGVDVDRVLAERKNYLTAINRDETNANFLKR